MGIGSAAPPRTTLSSLLSLATSTARGQRSDLLVTPEQAALFSEGSQLIEGESRLDSTAYLVWSSGVADLIRDWEGAAHPFMTDDGSRLVIPVPTGGIAIHDPGYAILSDAAQLRFLQVLAGLAAGTVRMATRMSEAAHRARALERTRHRLREQAVLLRELAVVDDLTGLYNRRFFDSRLGYELDRYHRYHCPLALVLFDVDHFKRVNDTYGHPVGDDVLRHLSKLGLSIIRRVDLLARFGGEEFALLLPNTSAAGAMEAAERVRQTIESRPPPIAEHTIRVTISAGVASTEQATLGDSESLVRAADQALYRAKRQGRNRVVLCEGDE